MYQTNVMCRNFKSDNSKKRITMELIEMLQAQLQNHYEWYLCERDDDGVYQERTELDDEDKTRLECISEISKALGKMM